MRKGALVSESAFTLREEGTELVLVRQRSFFGIKKSAMLIKSGFVVRKVAIFSAKAFIVQVVGAQLGFVIMVRRTHRGRRWQDYLEALEKSEKEKGMLPKCSLLYFFQTKPTSCAVRRGLSPFDTRTSTKSQWVQRLG